MALLIPTCWHVLQLGCYFLTLSHIKFLSDFPLTYKHNKNSNISSLFYHRNFLAARQGWWQIKVLYNIQYMFTGFISRHVRMEHYGSLPYVPEHNHENIDKSFQWPSTLDYILWNNQQMQLYAVNFIPLLGSLYTFRVFYTPIIRSTIYNCIYSHWYKP